MSRRKHLLLAGLGGFLGLLLLSVLSAVVVVHSDWFHDQVRQRIITEVERATGGKVEIGAFEFHWRDLRAVVKNLVLHGTEPPESPPLFRAESVTVGLRVVSAFRRDVDIALLEIASPELSIQMDKAGKTNFPRPAAPRQPGTDPLRPLIRLAIGKIRVTGGTWSYASRRMPLEFNGRDFVLHACWDAAAQGYTTRVSVHRLSVTAPESVPFPFDAEMILAVKAGRLLVQQARLASKYSTLGLTGEVETAPETQARFSVRARLSMKDLAPYAGDTLLPEGSVRWKGTAEFFGSGGYSMKGTLTAADLGVASGRIRISGIGGSASLQASPETLALSDLVVSSLGGTFTGSAVVEQFQTFHLDGDLADFSIGKLAGAAGIDHMPWSGVISGPVHLVSRISRGALADTTVTGALWVKPLPGEVPVEGVLDVSFDQLDNTLRFGPSQLGFGSTRLDFSGALGAGIRLSVFSENLDDLLPVLTLAGGASPKSLPVHLEKGVAQFGGLLSGRLGNPRFAGRLTAGPLRYRGRLIDEVTADFDLARDQIQFRSLSLRQGKISARGKGSATLSEWKLIGSSKLTGELNLKNAAIESLLANTGHKIPLAGVVGGTVTLSGTVEKPLALAGIHAKDITAYGEAIDSLVMDLRYSSGWLQIERGRLRASKGKLEMQGAYRHQPGEWNNGALNFEIDATDFHLRQWKAVQKVRAGLDAGVEGSFSGTVEFHGNRPRLTSLAGKVSITGIAMKDREIGEASLVAGTRRNVLMVRASSRLRDARIEANAEWSLLRESFGLGQINFNDLTLGTLQQLGLLGGPETDLHVDGVLDGEIGFTGPVLDPASWRGMAKVTRFEITPTAKQQQVSQRDLTLRNAGPLVFAIDPAKITIQTARLVSSDTDLEATGTLSYLKKKPWNLHLKGSANLAVLTAFRPDLSAEGTSTLDAAIRGSLLHPQINGRLRFSNGSFYLRGLPNGIEQVNGTILFDRTRATIEEFSSRTGGGNLKLSGFIGFGGEDWVYHLQVTAEKVRLRYPVGVSTQLSAQLDLTGSSTRSMLSGEVTVVRAAFHPNTDLGSILSEAATVRPTTAFSNPFLQGMQFDVHVTTAPRAEFLTSLTRDLELQADLSVRGSPSRPVVLGRVGLNRGVIQFFGNRYTITQGEVRFYNPVKIEPVLAMDLETRVRGYTVMITFTGPLDKLNFSYQSDPPLQSQEIIALLTVGRTPGYARMANRGTSATDQSFLRAGGNSLLGQALAAPVSSRLQRFFGVSRIKIDPQLTGVDNTPETHVTIEQQISRGITLTYVTNLARTQQQIVRVEWNFHPYWSVYAVRDSNGVFGMDFVYRRRFK